MPPVTAQQPGNGTATLAFTIPQAGMDVESVYAIIDASGAGTDVTAELTITDQSGVVIARKTQGTVIPAGGSGSATWALRLDDDRAASSGGGGIQFDTEPQAGDWLYWETTSAGPLGYGLNVKDGSPFGINIEQTGNGLVNIGADGTGAVNLYATDGDLTLSTNNGGFDLTVGAGGNGILLDNNSSGDTVITGDGATANVKIRANDTIELQVKTGGSGFLTFVNLPTVNPGGTNRVWNNGGVLNIT